MQIDLKKLIVLSKDKNKRKELGKNNIDIKSNIYPFIKDYTSYIENLSTYELSSIIIDKKIGSLVEAYWKVKQVGFIGLEI